MRNDKPYKIGKNYIEYKTEELPPMYMFLPVSVYSIDHFTTETLWGTSPTIFNDPFDSLGVVDKEIITKLFYEYYKKEAHLFDPNINKDANIKNLVEEIIKEFFSIRENFLISCFTPKIDSEIMWAHYGRNATGFALQYSAGDIINCSKNFFNKYNAKNIINNAFFCPVQYFDEPINLTKGAESFILYFAEAIAAAQNNKELEKKLSLTIPFADILIRKNTCWSYEEEYRLCVQNLPLYLYGEKNSHLEIGHCKPTAIYLGANIENSNEQILKRIAKEKEIPIFKMKAVVKNGKYCLIGEKIE